MKSYTVNGALVLVAFAVFGYVTKGIDVAKRIHSQPQEGQRLKPPIKIISITRI